MGPASPRNHPLPVPVSRRLGAAILVAVAGVLLPIGVIAGWADATLYNSDTFSKRAGNLLESPAIRHEIALQLTDRLASAGNKQAIDFRPAFELAVEGAAGTEAFRSIFRTAVATTHHDLLAGGEKGIDLSRATAVIATTLQLPDNARPGEKQAGSLGDRPPTSALSASPTNCARCSNRPWPRTPPIARATQLSSGASSRRSRPPTTSPSPGSRSRWRPPPSPSSLW